MGRMTSVGPLQVHWLGHATVVLDTVALTSEGEAPSRVLTDPLLRPHVGALRRLTPPPSRDDWAQPDAVLVSHLHLDHADLPSLHMAAAPVYASPPVATWLGRRGISTRALGADWEPIAADGRLETRLVPADHHSRPLPGRPSDAHGLLLRYGGVTPAATRHVWFAGDTADHPDLDQIPELAGGRIDLALLPIHGWGPRLSAGHLDPRGAARLAARLDIARVIPIHHGTLHPVGFGRGPLGWVHAPAREFAQAAADLAPHVQLIAPAPGGPPVRIDW